MVINFLLLIIGFILLVRGADIFVDGSAGLARNFKITPLVIGLTIVACGTSAPELAVSTLSAIRGSSEIAISNIVGSNLFNLLGILGLCALISPLIVSNSIIKRDFPVSIVSTVITFFLVGGWGLFYYAFVYEFDSEMNTSIGTVHRPLGFALVISYIVYVWAMIRNERRNLSPVDEGLRYLPTKKCVILILVGLGLIIGGGQMVVNTAQSIARMLGVSETLIGLTIVAIGTSLPELATSLIATKKHQLDLAVGNVIGSNIFNLLLILGVASIIQPVSVNLATMIDLLILSVVSILAFLFCYRKQHISKFCGGLMLAMYITIVMFAIYR